MAAIPFQAPKAAQSAAQILASADYGRILEILGNGDAPSGYSLLYAIVIKLALARSKSPLFARDKEGGAKAVLGASLELADSCLSQPDGKRMDKALDVIAAAIRLYGGEWPREQGE